MLQIIGATILWVLVALLIFVVAIVMAEVTKLAFKGRLVRHPNLSKDTPLFGEPYHLDGAGDPSDDIKVMNEEEIEQAVRTKGLTAPRVTPADIDGLIKGKTFTILPSGKCMICEITLYNGFTVVGKASVVSPENFDEEIGKSISFEDARNQIWQLAGYHRQCELYVESTPLRGD